MGQAAHIFDDRMPSVAEIDNANDLRQVLAGQITEDQPLRLEAVLNAKHRGELVLMPALARTLMEMLRHVGSGRSVMVVPTDEMMTTQKAADILNVSRPHLIKLLENGDIPYSTTGRHRRVQAVDVFAYKNKRDGRRSEALAELAELDADLI